MSTQTRIVLLIICIAAVLGAGYYFVVAPRLYPAAPVALTTSSPFGWRFPASATKFPSTGSIGNGDLAYSRLPDPGGVPSGLPLRLQIPIIGVDSEIEDALITPDGRMDVPAGTEDVAWFALGPQPGQVGSAVIGGHYGIQNNVPFVFYDLNKIKIGDDVYVTNDEGQNFTFVVRSMKSFGLNADATTVFTSSDGLAHLNLITCEGVWNEVAGNYPDRLVVFTDFVSSGGAAPSGPTSTAPAAAASASASNTFNQWLGIGSSGASVVALQTFLEQRGLLELPAGVSNGYFGTITSAALAHYQMSVGLPPVGVFGPLTRAKINTELTTTTLPDTGITGVASSTSGQDAVAEPSFVVASLQSAYATPLDGVITSVLIIFILFVILKIIWP